MTPTDRPNVLEFKRRTITGVAPNILEHQRTYLHELVERMPCADRGTLLLGLLELLGPSGRSLLLSLAREICDAEPYQGPL
jgi:hypothetical protein